jgi:hypothetical protein
MVHVVKYETPCHRDQHYLDLEENIEETWQKYHENIVRQGNLEDTGVKN